MSVAYNVIKPRLKKIGDKWRCQSPGSGYSATFSTPGEAYHVWASHLYFVVLSK